MPYSVSREIVFLLSISSNAYCCTVGAAEWTERVSDDESVEFYVTITLKDGTKVESTKMTGSMVEPSWYEEIHMCVRIRCDIYTVS